MSKLFNNRTIIDSVIDLLMAYFALNCPFVKMERQCMPDRPINSSQLALRENGKCLGQSFVFTARVQNHAGIIDML